MNASDFDAAHGVGETHGSTLDLAADAAFMTLDAVLNNEYFQTYCIGGTWYALVGCLSMFALVDAAMIVDLFLTAAASGLNTLATFSTFLYTGCLEGLRASIRLSISLIIATISALIVPAVSAGANVISTHVTESLIAHLSVVAAEVWNIGSRLALVTANFGQTIVRDFLTIVRNMIAEASTQAEGLINEKFYGFQNVDEGLLIRTFASVIAATCAMVVLRRIKIIFTPAAQSDSQPSDNFTIDTSSMPELEDAEGALSEEGNEAKSGESPMPISKHRQVATPYFTPQLRRQSDLNEVEDDFTQNDIFGECLTAVKPSTPDAAVIDLTLSTAKKALLHPSLSAEAEDDNLLQDDIDSMKMEQSPVSFPTRVYPELERLQESEVKPRLPVYIMQETHGEDASTDFSLMSILKDNGDGTIDASSKIDRIKMKGVSLDKVVKKEVYEAWQTQNGRSRNAKTVAKILISSTETDNPGSSSSSSSTPLSSLLAKAANSTAALDTVRTRTRQLNAGVISQTSSDGPLSSSALFRPSTRTTASIREKLTGAQALQDKTNVDSASITGKKLVYRVPRQTSTESGSSGDSTSGRLTRARMARKLET